MQGRLSKPRSSLIQEFPWESWREEFIAANKIGISIIEWTVDHFRILENPLFLKNMRHEIKELSYLHKIKICSVTLDNFVTAPLHKVNPITKKFTQIETLYWIIDHAIKKNIEILVIPIVAENGGENMSSLNELKKQMKLTQNYLKNRKLKIALECELKIENIEYLCNAFENFDNIGFNFDIGNSAALENNVVEEIKLYGDKLFNVHVKDRIVNGATVPLGCGSVNFHNVFKVLKIAGYSGNFILQSARIPNQDELITVKNYLNYCNKVMSSL